MGAPQQPKLDLRVTGCFLTVDFGAARMLELPMWLGVPWTLWGLLALLVACVYSVVWPRTRTRGSTRVRPAGRHLVLRWFHSMVWVLLALSCFIRTDLLPGGLGVANVAALLTVPTYAAFLGTLAIDRRSRRYKGRGGHRND